MTGGARFAGDRILAAATALAFPRYPGTAGDRRAIAAVTRAMEAAGLEVSRQEFSYDLQPAWLALRCLFVSSGLLTAAAGVLALRSAAGAVLVLLAAILPAGAFLAWAPWLEAIYRRQGPTRTANVEGRRRAADGRCTLILMAHHDSKSQSLTLPFRMGFTLAALAGAGILAALLLLALAGGGPPPGAPWAPLASAGVAAASLLLLATLRSGNRSPGGVDNAGSLGIVLELARILPRSVPEDVELIFLSTGAEEDHMVGAMRWLDAHAGELRERPAWALNFDGAGAPGPAVVLDRYGWGKAFSPTLSRLAREAAGELGIRLRSVLLPPGMGLDAIPFAHRGIGCLTLSSGSLGRAVAAVHSADDRAANLDPESLGEVAHLGLAIAEKIARRAGGGG